MNRYAQNTTTTRFDGKRVCLTTRYPTIPMGANDIYIIATETDFLDTLANTYYRDPTLWWIIAKANQIAGTLKAPTGQQLRIPMDVQGIVSNFFTVNK